MYEDAGGYQQISYNPNEDSGSISSWSVGVDVDYYQAPCAAPVTGTSIPISNYSTLLVPPMNDPPDIPRQQPQYPAPPTPFGGSKSVPVEQGRHISDNPVTPQALLSTSWTTQHYNIPDDNETPASPPHAEALQKPKNLNQRKEYFRIVSRSVGFTITDPSVYHSHPVIDIIESVVLQRYHHLAHQEAPLS